MFKLLKNQHQSSIIDYYFTKFPEHYYPTRCILTETVQRMEYGLDAGFHYHHITVKK